MNGGDVGIEESLHTLHICLLQIQHRDLMAPSQLYFLYISTVPLTLAEGNMTLCIAFEVMPKLTRST
jgi:hypothetical protein